MADNPERSEARLDNFYDYTKDARFESMWDYPRRTHLYRKHKDLRAECERKLKYYQRNQSIFCTETLRQQQIVFERFLHHQKHAIEESPAKSDNLKFSYNQFRDVPKRKESLIASLKSLRKSTEEIRQRQLVQMKISENSKAKSRIGRHRNQVDSSVGGFQKEVNLLFTAVENKGQGKIANEAPQSSKTHMQKESQQDNNSSFRPPLVRSVSSVGVPMDEFKTTDLILRRSATTVQNEVLRFLSEGPYNYKSPFHRRKKGV